METRTRVRRQGAVRVGFRAVRDILVFRAVFALATIALVVTATVGALLVAGVVLSRSTAPPPPLTETLR